MQERVLLVDDRLEVFVLPVTPGLPEIQSYYSFEVNKAGRCLTNINNSTRTRSFDRTFDGRPHLCTRLIGGEAYVTLLVSVAWAGVGVRPGETAVRVGLFRAQKPAELTAKLGGVASISADLAAGNVMEL